MREGEREREIKKEDERLIDLDNWHDMQMREKSDFPEIFFYFWAVCLKHLISRKQPRRL